MFTVANFCERALLLDKGELIASGACKEVVKEYSRILQGMETRPSETIGKSIPSIASNNNLIKRSSAIGTTWITGVGLCGKTGPGPHLVEINSWATVMMEVMAATDCNDVFPGMMIRTIDGVDCFHSNGHIIRRYVSCRAGLKQMIEMQFCANLCPGTYTITVDLQRVGMGKPTTLDVAWDVILITVPTEGALDVGGIARLPFKIDSHPTPPEDQYAGR